ncbi:MAG: sortase [Actinobacteria bacterium]|nr:sortase [Actinomycetota bacterium]
MKVVEVIGKFLISVGVGILLFVAWTLWGTRLYTDGQQAALADEFGAAPRVSVSRSGGPPEGYAPARGEAVFRLRIPSIRLIRLVVEGVGSEELRKGPGHYPECRRGFSPPLCMDFDSPWPGETGRVIVSGHRTTYGQPFWDLDKLERGDEIVTVTKWGTFTYEVTRKQIVQPTDATIVRPSDVAELVLTTCNPRFSASQRLIVYAELRR